MDNPRQSAEEPEVAKSPEFELTGLQDFSSILQELSLNVSHTKGGRRKPDQTSNSSLGLLNTEAMASLSGVSECEEAYPALQQWQESRPCPAPPPQQWALLDSVPQQWGDASPAPLSPPRRWEESNPTPQYRLGSPDVSLGRYLQPDTSLGSLASQPLQEEEERVEVEEEEYPSPLEQSVFPWDKLVQSAGLPLQDKVNISEWQGQDPSFCSGKFSARSTSFGSHGFVNNTRDENFSDFSKIPSFQSQGSFASQYSSATTAEDLRSGLQSQQSLGSAFPSDFDAAAQAELGIQFGDQEFGTFGKKEELKKFLDEAEAECLKENPFIAEEECEGGSGDSTAMSGVSDKSIMLRHSGLYGGDTSQVDLVTLRRESQQPGATRLSRCEYFRHNSSRLGSLEDSVAEEERPGLGFVHNIRSPERRPCALLEAESGPVMSATFSKPGQDRDSSGSGSGSDSAPSSANTTTCLASGDSTKTVVSLMEQTDTLKAEELVVRLQSLADQLGGNQSSGPASYPDVVNDSIAGGGGQLEESIRETLGDAGREVDLSTISRALSEASVSSDPQHFVKVILGCLKERAARDSQAPVPSLPAAPIPAPLQRAATTPLSGRGKTGKSSLTPAQPVRNSTESRRAMSRLAPSPGPAPARPARPIQPFSRPNTEKLAPVRPQSSSAPTSARATPTPPLEQDRTTPPPPVPCRADSLPTSLDSSRSGRQRSRSGARHSSPKKAVQLPPARLSCTPTEESLSRLLDSTSTPTVQVGLASQVTTSTPFHPAADLSRVTLQDQLGTSISPLVCPDTSLAPVSLDLSTLSPALTSSLAGPAPRPAASVLLWPDWSYPQLVAAHSKLQLPVPVRLTASAPTPAIVKITNLWVGSCEVPAEHWPQLVDTQWETLVTLEPGRDCVTLDLVLIKEGALTLNVGIALDNGVSSSGLVRVQVEEPKLQVLTDNGVNLDFGSLSHETEKMCKLELVNRGQMDLNIGLQIQARQAQVFSFEDGSSGQNFVIPGSSSLNLTQGQEASASYHTEAVSKRLSLVAKYDFVSVDETKIFKTDIVISLNPACSPTQLGSVDMVVKCLGPATRAAAPARPVLSFGMLGQAGRGQGGNAHGSKTENNNNSAPLPAVFPVQSDRTQLAFLCVGEGGEERQVVSLRNSSESRVVLAVMVRESDRFLVSSSAQSSPAPHTQLTLPPAATQTLTITYRPAGLGPHCGKLVLKPQAAGGKSFKASITLAGLGGTAEVLPECEDAGRGGYKVKVEAGELVLHNSGSRPGLVRLLSAAALHSPLRLVVEPGTRAGVSLAGAEAGEVVLLAGPLPLAGLLSLPGSGPLPGLLADWLEGSDDLQAVPAPLQLPGPLGQQDLAGLASKVQRLVITLVPPARQPQFDQLAVEETLSETRIDCSIAMPLPALPPISQPGPVLQPKFVPPPPATPAGLLLRPRRVVLVPGGEAVVRLSNPGPEPVHWDLSWPGSKLAVQPGSGRLAPRAESVVCLKAEPGAAGWRGQVQVYSDNSVASLEVEVGEPGLVPQPRHLVMPATVVGSMTTAQLSLTNPAGCLVQWRAATQPPFSLPANSGLLNPGQTVGLGVQYRPGRPGQHSASLSLSCQPVQGGPALPPTAVSLTGTATNPAPPPAGKPELGPIKKSSGTLSVESQLVLFPTTRVGDVSVSKVKLKNRSGSDQTVQLLPLSDESQFHTQHTCLEIKNQCYLAVPVQFKPRHAGDFTTTLTFSWEGKFISTNLKGSGV